MNDDYSTKRDGPLAFTSVEVLAATVLASCLMVAVLGVLGGIAKKERLLEKSGAAPTWHDQLARQLEADLRQARSLRREPGRLILIGHGGTTGVAGDRTWLESEIHYYAVSMKKESMLLRQEFSTTLPSRPGNPEIVAYGVDQLELTSYAPALSEDSIPTQLTPIEPLPEGPIPARVRVMLFDTTDVSVRNVVFDRSFFLY